jgi:hypothetical protein
MRLRRYVAECHRIGPTGLARRLRMPNVEMHPDQHVRPDASVLQIWVTDASARIDALSACVLPHGFRPCVAGTQRAGGMVVKGWPRRLTFCVALSL